MNNREQLFKKLKLDSQRVATAQTKAAICCVVTRNNRNCADYLVLILIL